MAEKVYWVDLQSKLVDAGLDVSLHMPRGSTWHGTIDKLPFAMTLGPARDDGTREFLMVSLYGQNEEKVIPLLSIFMGYQPFCKYLHKVNKDSSATYEWDCRDPSGRFGELEKDANVFVLSKLEEGFQSPKFPDLDEYFQQFTPDIIKKWEGFVVDNPDAEYNEIKIRLLLPLIKKIMPLAGKSQSLFGLSIISLEGKVPNEENVVRYGLKPFLAAGILSQNEVDAIVGWYLNTRPGWDSGGSGDFQKDFEIDGTKYRLITDSYRNYRDLNLQTLN